VNPKHLLCAVLVASCAAACAGTEARASEPEPRVVAVERLGLVFSVDEQGAIVTAVTDEGAAFDVSPGARLAEIDGAATSGRSPEAIERALSSPDLTRVALDTGDRRLEIWLRPGDALSGSAVPEGEPGGLLQLDLASIETLTSGAPVLARAFDERAGVVQLVMLLSPT
jgi:hypothetical protein